MYNFFRFLFFLFLTSPILGDDYPIEQNLAAFKKNYVTFEIVRNHPYADSQSEFYVGDAAESFGFHHLFNNNWMLGVNVGFKRLTTRETNKKVTIVSFSEESVRMFRLYHPFYFGLGGKLMILVPSNGKKIPPDNRTEYGREVGVGVVGKFLYTLSDNLVLSIRLDRWRGVDREVFQATETAVGIHYAL